MTIGDVLDYSDGFPSPQLVKNAGYLGAIRYIGFPGRLKCTTKEELQAYTNSGLGVALVYENNASDWMGGRQEGLIAGYRARGHARQIGFPDNRPIYVAIDQQIVHENDITTMLQYVAGFSTAMDGFNFTGVYGSYYVCDAVKRNMLASYFWQTTAWSHGLLYPRRNLFQTVDQSVIDGVKCDINQVETEDWGQHIMALTQDDVNTIVNALMDTTVPRLGPYATDPGAPTNTLRNTIAWWANNTDDVRTEILAIKGILGGLTLDTLKVIVQEAVQQHIQVTGNVQIGPA